MKKLFKRSLLSRGSKMMAKDSTQFSNKFVELVTEQDIYYCYRLFLQREPDKEGFEFWKKYVDTRRPSLWELSHRFMFCDEARHLRADKSRKKLVELEKFKIFVRPNDFDVGATIAATKIYEPYVTYFTEKLLKPGHVFLDIGANIGYFTLLAASIVESQGKVIAVEPNPENCALLESSIKENDFKNIELYNLAAAEKEKSFMLYASESSSLSLLVDGNSITNYPEDSKTYSIKGVALDELLENDKKRIDIIKIDIDGGEPLVIKGMVRLIRRHHPIIFTEFAPKHIVEISNVTPEFYLNQLRELGYELAILVGTTENNKIFKNNSEIMVEWENSGSSHLDLVGYPR